jgi:hypothetical protein
MDAAGIQKALNPVVTRLAVHIGSVVIVRVKRIERDSGSPAHFLEVLIEQGFPRCGVELCGICDDAIRVKENRVKVFARDGESGRVVVCAVSHDGP